MSSLSSESFSDEDVLELAEHLFDSCPDEQMDSVVIEFCENREDVFNDFARKRLEKVKSLDLSDLLDSVEADITHGRFVAEAYEDKIFNVSENLNIKTAALLIALAANEVNKHSDGIVLFSGNEECLSQGTVN